MFVPGDRLEVTLGQVVGVDELLGRHPGVVRPVVRQLELGPGHVVQLDVEHIIVLLALVGDAAPLVCRRIAIAGLADDVADLGPLLIAYDERTKKIQLSRTYSETGLSTHSRTKNARR